MPKPNRSALYFYASEYQQRQRSRGQRLNIGEAIAACYDDWKALSDAEKQQYKQQYEDWRLQSRSSPVPAQPPRHHAHSKQSVSNDKTLHGRDIPSEELRQHYDRFGFEQNFLACEYLPLDKNELLIMPIYMLNFQIFCKVDDEDGGQFIPAEMCILRYTLNDGVTAYEHKFIKPESIPTGYTSSCLEHARETHEIPLKDFGEATNNYKLLYQQLKAFLTSTRVSQTNRNAVDDDRTRRRYLRLSKPCIFCPAREYEQTSQLFDWLHEKAEGRKPTKDTRLVHFVSVESLIMVLAELAKQRASRDDICRTFENTAYSFLTEQRCPYHSRLGICHCSVTRCHAAAKLISAYLNQLYVPQRPASAAMAMGNSSPNSHLSNLGSPHTDYQRERPSTYMKARTTPESFHPIEVPPTVSRDSLASSYTSFDQGNRPHSHRSLAYAETFSPSVNSVHGSESIDTDIQRNALNQRKQILLQALQTIDQQIEQLNLE